MTESVLAGGRVLLSVEDGAGAREAALLDRVVELVLALEPLELKQGEAGDAAADAAAGEGADASPAPGDDPAAPTLVSESTQRMLMQMGIPWLRCRLQGYAFFTTDLQRCRHAHCCGTHSLCLDLAHARSAECQQTREHERVSKYHHLGHYARRLACWTADLPGYCGLRMAQGSR